MAVSKCRIDVTLQWDWNGLHRASVGYLMFSFLGGLGNVCMFVTLLCMNFIILKNVFNQTLKKWSE